MAEAMVHVRIITCEHSIRVIDVLHFAMHGGNGIGVRIVSAKYVL